MEQKQIIPIPLENLKFDTSNPRLTEFNVDPKISEEQLIGLLCDVMAVDEIILSIVNSGFFLNDPLIGIKSGKHFIVIEGNRRLAAVKVIVDYAKYKEYYPKGIPLPSKKLIASLQELPVLVENSKKDSWQFIGFKHVNGPAKWGSYAKAQYISQVHNEYEVPLEQIALQIGDTNKTVQKLYQALMVIDQAERRKLFDRTEINAPRLYFSHLYTALQFEGFREYLSLKDFAEDTSDPVDKTKFQNLEDTLDWLFGNKKKDITPVIQSQNPDLRQLDAVLKSPQAVAALKDTRDLSTAYEISQPDDYKFSQSLNEAKRALYKTLQYVVTGFKGDEDSLRTAGSLADMADQLYTTMEARYTEKLGKEKKSRLSEK